MFQTLSSAMLPKVKKQKLTATVTTKTDEQKTPNFKLDIPNIDLEPIEDYNTIDDNLLQELLTDMPMETENRDPNIQNAVVAQSKNITPANLQNGQNFNTQINTVNNQMQMPVIPNSIPPMANMSFTNSTVTINYNFGK